MVEEEEKLEEGKEEERKGIRGGICPRCGKPFKYIEARNIHGRTYYYAVHGWGEAKKGKGKRNTIACYLGPKGYVYAETTNQLTLAGFVDEQRYIRYVINLLEELDEKTITNAERSNLVNLVTTAIQKLDRDSLRVIWQTTANRLKELKKLETQQKQQ
jgi:hypothetical protein